MFTATEEKDFFESCKQALLGEHLGKFAIVCGSKLIGVQHSLEQALQAAADAFGKGDISDGAPVLINEIGEAPSVRVVAHPMRAPR